MSAKKVWGEANRISVVSSGKLKKINFSKYDYVRGEGLLGTQYPIGRTGLTKRGGGTHLSLSAK